MPARPTSVFPKAFLAQPHSATRLFTCDRKLARITLLFQKHTVAEERNVGDGVDAHLIQTTQPSEESVAPGCEPHGDFRLYSVTYAVAGRARIRYPDERDWQDVKAGDLFQLNGHDPGQVLLRFEKGFTECSVCLDAVTGRYLDALGVWNSQYHVRTVGLRDDIIRGYVGFYHFIREPERSNRALLKEFMQLVELLQGQEELRDRDTDFKEHACHLLNEHLSPAVPMSKIAKLMGLSDDVFRKRFRQLVGLSPTSYRLARRMERARALLRDYSVKETAAALGYSQASAFSRQFKKWSTQAPKTLRRDGNR